MKAARVIAPRNLEICEVPEPEIKSADEVLIKVKTAGICGSDIHIYHGTNPIATYPRVLGHEFAGEIVATGEGITDFMVGAHVVMDPVNGCGHCYPCSIGRPNVCSNIQVRGAHVDGGFQEYVVIPRKSVYKISQELPWEEAALVEPFSVSAQVVSRAEITPKDTVFIMGAGPIGLCILQAIKSIGAKCFISELREQRLQRAKEMGADLTINAAVEDVNEVVMAETAAAGVPVVVDTVCLPQTLEQALKLACPAGRVIVMGLTVKPSQISQLEIMKKELDVKGSRLNSNKFPTVIEWFEKKKVKPRMLISHVFHFRDTAAALEKAENHLDETCKIVLKFD
jgi:threonine dehydrogenase-like Zn-dependent dehydrogenase